MGCGNNLDIESGVNIDGEALEFSFVNTETLTAEIEGDDGETTEVNAQAILLALSDRSDFCSAFGSIESVEELDGQAVILAAVEVADAVTTDGYDSNATLGKVLFDPEPGDRFVGVQVLNTSDGEPVERLSTTNLASLGATSEASFFISSQTMSSGEVRKMSASFDATLGASMLDPESYDVDADDDGESDYTGVDIPISGRFAGAEPCDSLTLF